ncbi:MAG: hypothetical protein ACREGC_00010 [Minisyncoccia bacterium]
MRQAEIKGRKALILDPLSSVWGSQSHSVQTIEEMIKYAKENPNLLLVVDESALSFDRYDPTQFWVAKVSRHNGHSSIFIGQNLPDIPKGVRTQCTQIFIFGCSRTDGRQLADEFDDDRILMASKMPRLHFVRIFQGVPATMGKVNPQNMTISIAGPAPQKLLKKA